ncbi:sensor histidine kinase [Salinimicrobium oceani]|uniref:histidine kinase n=1 Tax=Salinimicrobium oceani TaxID=2722702 RepID=A0ABX1D0D1_9FLAO|nr:PAS domain-containing sensor histidine kinase [Salinimicrobium oceani]NJW53745.1 PAS domain-containing sensor histidine kinase [Salinimicrobium oceani]
MRLLKNIENNSWLQSLVGICSIFLISFLCYLFGDLIGYHVVALILLLAVSILAMFLDTIPIVAVAVVSALTWNFLFIQPKATFNITTPQDALLFLMYFVIAVINAVFTSRLRKLEGMARDRKEREKTLQLYNTLLNSLSHELKTPISTIIAAVDTLKMTTAKISENNIEELYNELEVAGTRLHRQVNNLLSMSRLESDFLKLQLDWYDVHEIIHNVIDVNKSSTHFIKFAPVAPLPLFKIDGILLEQALQNIIHNALEYTPQETIVSISTSFTKRGFKIEISDTGQGFPEDKLDMVFEKFYRLPNSATGGTGLGLSIAKGFIKAHNGSIGLLNSPSGGAKFTIEIPAEMAALTTTEDE